MERTNISLKLLEQEQNIFILAFFKFGVPMLANNSIPTMKQRMVFISKETDDRDQAPSHPSFSLPQFPECLLVSRVFRPAQLWSDHASFLSPKALQLNLEISKAESATTLGYSQAQRRGL